MDKEQKTLKSPLSAKNTINPLHCEECKAKVAGESQKSIAREALYKIKDIRGELRLLESIMKEILK